MTQTWVLYGIGSAICFAGMTLVYKKLLSSNINPLVLNLFVFGLTFFGFIIWSTVTKTKIELTTSLFLFLILASIFALMGNFLDVKAIKDAPNPGYANTLKATQLVLITLIAPFLFNSSLTWQKLGGVILVLVGGAIISLS